TRCYFTTRAEHSQKVTTAGRGQPGLRELGLPSNNIKRHMIMKLNQSELDTLQNTVRRGFSRLAMLACLGLAGLLAVPQARCSSTLTSVSVGEQVVGVIDPGGAATFPVTVTRTGAGRIDISLTVSGLPAGA